MRIRGSVRSRGSVNLLAAVVAFTVVIAVSYAAFYEPILYSDDWSHIIEGLADSRWNLIDLSSRRPLVHAPILFLHALFGLNIHAFYGVLILCQLAVAVGMYYLFTSVDLDPLLSLCTVLLFVVYPADYSRMWLNMLHVRFVYVLLLLYGWLLLVYSEKGDIVALFLALLCLLVSLGVYEAHLGLALGWSVFMLWRSRCLGLRRKIGLLSPLMLALVFAFWRTYGVGRAGVYDNYLESMMLSPAVLLDRLRVGFRVLVWSWIEVFREAYGGGADWVFVDLGNLRHYLAIVATILLGWFGVALLSRNATSSDVLARDTRLGEVRTAGLLLLVGGLSVIAGYLPIITVYYPNLVQHDSRVNIFAMPGASLCIVALIYVVSLVLARSLRQARVLLVVGVVPLLLVGVVTQIWIQYDAKAAWEDQKSIWTELFELVPSAADGTQILLVFPGYQERTGPFNWRRTPFSSQWEVRSAVRVLYGNPSLSADVYFPELDNMVELREEGVVSLWTQEVAPYDEMIVLLYAGQPRHLRVVDDLQSELGLTWATPQYDPGARILSAPKSVVKLRRLVE